MVVLNQTSRKKETYQVEIKYSILWECALGIAAITNTTLLDTLEKPRKYWKEIRKSLSTELLNEIAFVEEHNTWKSLLQLLHIKDFADLQEFISYINVLPINDLKYHSLPFIGDKYQLVREKAAKGSESAINEMKEHTHDNSFFPSYIQFISEVDGETLKEHLIAVLSGWYLEVIEKDEVYLQQILQTDCEMKKRMKLKLKSEDLVEWSTGGVAYTPEPSVNHVLLIPHYIYRPWNIEADMEDTKIFYYPIANESISPCDRYLPDNFLLLKYKALGDEVRLKIVKLLYEEERTLQDITNQINIGKSTIHHHLKILRAAKLVEIVESKYSLKKKAIEFLPEEMNHFLRK
ncbi:MULTISPECIES: ArsR/SmtB family transcription factor [Bacillus]|uniref:ArsR/SmtB family transcription factor n=1 Tax=Bacillus TaxID=1386 RepID=UPI0002D66F90|nr:MULTISPECIES: winged helix-turn-helix domain-containing protein [Bacillus]